MENSIGFPQEIKTRAPFNPTDALLGIYLKDVKAGSYRDICKPIFFIALFKIAERRKQNKCPETDEWINKVWYKYYSGLKMKEFLSCATT